MNALFYSPMGLRGDRLVALFVNAFLTGYLCPLVMAQPFLFRDDFQTPLDNQIWKGDFASFRVEPTAKSGMLRLDASTDESTAYLATLNSFEPVSWEWYIRQDFTPSDNNQAFFFLNLDGPDPENLQSGMAVRTGENGSPKYFRLIQFDDTSQENELLKSDVEIRAETGYRIRIIHSPDNIIHLYVSDGFVSTPLLQSESFTPAHTRASINGHFGFITHFTATRSDRFFIGDVMLSGNLPVPEITDVSVSSAAEANSFDSAVVIKQAAQNRNGDTVHKKVVDDNNENLLTELHVTFRVPPDTSEIIPSLFQLDDGTAPVYIECPHMQVCKLGFSRRLVPGKRWLRVNSYTTIYNQLSRVQQKTFLIADTAEPGNVIINEFMYRPPIDNPPYVELYNPSDKLINLKGWRLQRRLLASEPDRTISPDDLFLNPRSYLILTPDPVSLDPSVDAKNTVIMNDFPRFNISSSDEIRLFSDDDTLIDSLEYTPSTWGGDQVALERKSPQVPGWLMINWAESLSGTGGTPGYENTAKPPEYPPSLLKTDYLNAEKLIVVFDRMLDAETLAKSAIFRLSTSADFRSANNTEFGKNHTITDEIPLDVEFTQPALITLIPEEPLQHKMHYNLHLSGIRDIFGNTIPGSEYYFTFYETLPAETGDIIINEVLYRPGDDGHYRFIELLNRSNKVFDLRGWQTGRSLGRPVTLFHADDPEPVYLLSGEIMVLSEPGFQSTNNGDIYLEINDFPSLSRLGDSVYIRSADGMVTDSLSYDPVWGGNRDGISLERVDPDGATADSSNWMEHPNSHTAGQQNFHFNDQLEPPVIIRAAILENQLIQVIFNRFVRRKSLQDVRLGGRPLHLQYDADCGQEKECIAAIYVFQSDTKPERSYQEIRIHSVQDVAGRTRKGLTAPLAFKPETPDLVINEVMYQPISARYSDRPDQSEYVEIFNRSGLVLQLQGIHLHDRPDKQGSVSKIKPAQMEHAILLPEEYAVIYPDTNAHFSNTRIYNAFNLFRQHHPHYYRTDRMTLGLSTQGDEVYISDSNGHILDSLWYKPSWHNPNLIDNSGVSIERIHPHMETQKQNNWTSNTTSEGGSPGWINSVATIPHAGNRSGLTLEPNPFSPTGDGNDDHLVIRYDLDDPDYLMYVRIFDRHGRLIRTLANGERAGRSGELLWDGRSENGIMGRIGIYIIHFEADHPAAGRNRQFREIVVIAGSI
ncbi:MAG: lamin tail domain-containing protein [Balneolales bacterium]